jgi:two-component system response regulator HydG
MPSVLIVDDLLSIHEMLEAVIQPTGFATSFATDGEKALVRYKAEKFDLVLADIDMKPMDGITLLKQLKLYDPNSIIIIMTAYASTESAVQALKFGAFDYLQKPFRVDDLIATLRRGVEFKRFQTERALTGLVPSSKPEDLEGRLIGQSPVIKKLIQQIRKLAAVRTPVLLQGENGTGKIAVAEILQGVLGQNGTGGTWVQQAKGGTLFLQHLQCLSLIVQKELVSVLRNTAHGFRLICTTTEDLEKMSDEGRFHDELFYRVASLPVLMPALRERPEDIPLIVKQYAAKAANPHFDANFIEFTDDAMGVLTAYHWPGNLTELFQVISKVAAGTETRVITSSQLPLRLRELKHWPALAEYLAGQEKQYIDLVLHVCRDDKAVAAKVLGVDIAKLG